MSRGGSSPEATLGTGADKTHVRNLDSHRPSKQSSRLTAWILGGCLIYLMVRPVGYNEVLLPVLGVMVVVSVSALILGRRRASTAATAPIVLLVLLGVWGALVGATNPGFTAGLLVWVVAPIMFGAWSLAGDINILKSLLRVCAWTTIALSAVVTAYVAGSAGWVPQLVPQPLLEAGNAGFNVEGGATAIRLLGLSTLAAAAPMWIVGALGSSSPLLPSRNVMRAAAVSSIIAATLGGRSAIILVAIAVPLAIRGFILIRRRSSKRRKIPRNAALGGITAAAVSLFALPALANQPSFRRAWESLNAYLNGATNLDYADQTARTTQSDQLIAAWSDSPVIGHGWGAVIGGFARSDERPWNFELQYHAILFQVGLVGAVTLIGIAALVWRAVRQGLRARPDMHPVFLVALASAMGMLTANATNPYLQAPGHMWSIYLLVMTANVAILADKPSPVALKP